MSSCPCLCFLSLWYLRPFNTQKDPKIYFDHFLGTTSTIYIQQVKSSVVSNSPLSSLHSIDWELAKSDQSQVCAEDKTTNLNRSQGCWDQALSSLANQQFLRHFPHSSQWFGLILSLLLALVVTLMATTKTTEGMPYLNQRRYSHTCSSFISDSRKMVGFIRIIISSQSHHHPSTRESNPDMPSSLRMKKIWKGIIS